MLNLQIKQKHSLKAKQIQRLISKIKLANVISLSDEKYNILIKEIEENPIFIKLMYSENKKENVLSYRRFPGTSVPSGFYGLKEGITIARKETVPDFIDIDSMMKGKESVVQLIKNVGEEKFKKYFLYNEENSSLGEIADKCNIGKNEAREIIDLLNTIDIYNAFNDSSTAGTGYQKKYVRIASIKKASSDNKITGADFVIEFFFINFTRGKYLIDYDKIETLKKEKYFSREIFRDINKLIGTMELINAKKITIYKVIEKIIEKQNKYLKSENFKDLIPFTEKQMASELGVDCSVISRAISARSVETPWGEEKPLKSFLPSKKNVRKELIYNIISREEVPYTDNEVREKLREGYGINISRRSVASCRFEMDLPSNYKRKKQERK